MILLKNLFNKRFFFTFHNQDFTLLLELQFTLFHYMQCPTCQNTDSRVLESRSADSGKSVRRRRECLNCNFRFTTYERVETMPVSVIKKDGSRELFDKQKLFTGILRACEKTNFTSESIMNFVDGIMFLISEPIDDKEATIGNGSTIGFSAKNAEDADAWHEAGINNGGTTCEDPPGVREDSNIYLAYLRDPAGNKICALHRLS